MTCSHCGIRRELSDLIEVTHYRTGLVRYICRSGIDARCFWSVGPATQEGIAPADRAAERRGLESWPEPYTEAPR